MSSEVTTERLSAYLDRELPEEERLELEARLERDPAARRDLESLRRVVAELGRLEAALPPVTLEGRIARAVAAERAKVGLFDRLEAGMAVLGRQSTTLLMFAVIIALAVMILLFAQALEIHERSKTQVIFADPESIGALEGDRLELAERIFRRRGGIWLEEGVDAAQVALVLEADSPEGRVFLGAHPELEPLGRTGQTFVFGLGGEVVRLVGSPRVE